MDFTAVEIRVGTVIEAEGVGGALRLAVRFGAGDVRRATARITERYGPADVLGRQVVAVMRPPRAGDAAADPDGDDAVVLAAVDPLAGATLLAPDRPVPDGTLVV
jgi:tRNA-binding protein